MRLDNRSASIAILLILISRCLILYAAMAHIILAREIYEDEGGGVSWRTTPSGYLFPWPREPGLLQAISRINEVDQFIYRYLIRSWVLVALSVLAWVGTGLYMSRAVEARLSSSP